MQHWRFTQSHTDGITPPTLASTIYATMAVIFFIHVIKYPKDDVGFRVRLSARLDTSGSGKYIDQIRSFLYNFSICTLTPHALHSHSTRSINSIKKNVINSSFSLTWTETSGFLLEEGCGMHDQCPARLFGCDHQAHSDQEQAPLQYRMCLPRRLSCRCSNTTLHGQSRIYRSLAARCKRFMARTHQEDAQHLLYQSQREVQGARREIRQQNFFSTHWAP